jgi:hypothetical protein
MRIVLKLNRIFLLLEKLTVFQLVEKFPAFYGTRRFTAAFTSARHLSLSRATSIQSTPPHPTSWISIIILPSTPGSLKWTLSLRFPHQNPVYASPVPHTCYMARPPHRIFFSINNSIISCSLTGRPFFRKNSEAYVRENVALHKIRFRCIQRLVLLKTVQFMVIIFLFVLSYLFCTIFWFS